MMCACFQGDFNKTEISIKLRQILYFGGLKQVNLKSRVFALFKEEQISVFFFFFTSKSMRKEMWVWT